MFGCTYYLCYIIQGMLLSTILYECIILECTGKNYYKYIYVTIHYMATYSTTEHRSLENKN